MSTFMNALKSGKKYDSDEIVVKNIPLDQIEAEEQVRYYYDEEKLQELTYSIAEHGVQNPIHVRSIGKNKYIVLTGERRFRATQKTEFDSIPCIVHEQELTTGEIRTLQLLENLQREDLSGIEVAKGFNTLSKEGYSAQKIARAIGISETTVSKANTILKRLNSEWLYELEKKRISIHEVYNVAKEKSKQKRAGLYQALMKKHDVEIEVVVEKKEKKPKISTEFTENEWQIVWDHLKKVTRRDKTLLSKYFTSKKVQAILDLENEE